MKLTDKEKLDMLQRLRGAGQRFLSDDEFSQQFERGRKMARDSVADGITMQFWLYGRNYDPDITGVDRWALMPILLADWPPEGMEKDDAMKALGVMYADKFPDFMLVNVVQLSEAWMVERKNTVPKEDMDLAPSKDSNRIEVAMVNAMSLDRRQSWWTAKIERAKDESFAGLKTLKEEIYNPAKPKDPRDLRAFLIEAIFTGYNLAREKKQNAKTR